MNGVMTALLVLHEKRAKRRPSVPKVPPVLAIGMGLAIFGLVAISVGRPLLDVGSYLVLHQTLPRYDYSGYSSHLPSHLRAGEPLTTAWLSYVHTQEHVSGGPRPVMLRTILVSEHSWKQELCGHYQAAAVLERIVTDDRSGFPYLFAPAKQIRLPTVPPGTYYIVQEVRLPTVASCSSNPLRIDP